MSSDSKNPYNNNYASVITIDVVTIFLAVGFTALRFYVRRCIVKKLELDDWLLLAGTIAFLVMAGLDIWCWAVEIVQGVDVGGSKHFQLLNIEGFPYFFCEVLIRAAYTVFYLKLLPSELDDFKWQRYTLLISFSVYSTYQIISAFLNLFQCGLPSNIGDSDAVCIDSNALANMYAASYGFDVVLDWLMALMPILVISKSAMTRRTKVGAISILLLGCLASVIAILIIPLNFVGVSGYTNSADQASSMVIDILAQLETTVVIVCMSLAACRPLFAGFLDQSQLWSAPHSELVVFDSAKKDGHVEVRQLDDSRLSMV